MTAKFGNHVLCHNVSFKVVRVTKLVSIHMFLGARNLIMPIKMFLSCAKFKNSYLNLFFAHFCSFFVSSPWVREGYSTYNKLSTRQKYFLLG